MGQNLSCATKRNGCFAIRPNPNPVNNLPIFTAEPPEDVLTASVCKVMAAPSPPAPPQVAGMSSIETMRWRSQHLDLSRSPCRPPAARSLDKQFGDDCARTDISRTPSTKNAVSTPDARQQGHDPKGSPWLSGSPVTPHQQVDGGLPCMPRAFRSG